MSEVSVVQYRVEKIRAYFNEHGCMTDEDMRWLLETTELSIKALTSALINGAHPDYCPGSSGKSGCKCWIRDAFVLTNGVRIVERRT